jgi:FkbM family methyltransferase
MLGQNVGNYSKKLANIFKWNAKIFSFEPASKTFSQLRTSLTKYPDIKQFNFGFGDSDTQADLYSVDKVQDSGLSSLYHRRLEHFDMKIDVTEKVEIRAIHNFC